MKMLLAEISQTFCFRMLIVFFLVAGGFATQAEGLKAKVAGASKKSDLLQPANVPAPGDFASYTMAMKKKSAASGSERTPATATQVTGPLYSADHRPTASDLNRDQVLNAIYTAFERIKTAEDLERFLKEQDELYSTGGASLAAQFLRANLSLLRPWRSIIFKVSPVYDQDYVFNFKNSNQVLKSFSGGVYVPSRVITNWAVGHIRSLATVMSIYLPTDQWDAGFDYLVSPRNPASIKAAAGEGAADPNSISNDHLYFIADLQKYLIEFVAPSVRTAILRLNEISDAVGDQYLLLDNRILYMSQQGYAEGVDQYKLISQPEILQAIAVLEYGLHALYTFCAYDFNQMPRYFAEVGKVKGLGGFLPWVQPGGTDEDKVEGVLREKNKVEMDIKSFFGIKGKYEKFMTLHPMGKQSLQEAFRRLRYSVKARALAWEIAKKRRITNNPHIMTRWERLSPYQRQIDHKIANAIAMTYPTQPTGTDVNSLNPEFSEGDLGLLRSTPTAFKSAISSEIVKIKLAKFYLDPVKDLKKLMPIGYKDGEKWLMPYGEQFRYRNFYYKQADQWDGIWGQYVDLGGKGDPADVQQATRIVRQSWGGHALSAWMFVFAK